MSYILDALKKAERERGPARVPTLATMHSSREVGRPFGLWAICGGFVVCAAVATWLFLPSSSTVSPRMREPLASTVALPPAGPPAAESTQESGRLPASSPSPRPSEVLQPPGVESTRESVRLPAAPPSPAHSEKLRPPAGETPEGVSSFLRGDPEATARSTPAPLRPPARSSSPRTAEEPRPWVHQPAAAVTVPSPVERAPKDASIAETSPQTARQPIPEVGSPPASAPQLPPPPPVAASVALPTLQEAMSKMTLNVLAYGEAAAERMVIINGRQYVQGDYIDGRYRIEDITPEGPVLSFHGERAILRP